LLTSFGLDQMSITIEKNIFFNRIKLRWPNKYDC